MRELSPEMDLHSPRFSCPACGQRFHWRAEFAGRAVRCKCGASFTAALGEPELIENRPPPLATERADNDASGDVALEEAAAEVATPRQRRVIATNLPRRAGRPIHEMAVEADETGPWRDWFIPIGLIAVGAIARFSQIMVYAGNEKLSTSKAIVLWFCEMLIGAAAMLGAAVAVAGMLGVNFGAPGRAVLKLVGIWLIASSAACVVAKLDAEPMTIRGMVLAFHVVLLIYFIATAALFKLDLQEALVSAVVVTLVQGLLLFGIARSMSPDAARALFFG